MYKNNERQFRVFCSIALIALSLVALLPSKASTAEPDYVIIRQTEGYWITGSTFYMELNNEGRLEYSGEATVQVEPKLFSKIAENIRELSVIQGTESYCTGWMSDQGTMIIRLKHGAELTKIEHYLGCADDSFYPKLNETMKLFPVCRYFGKLC